MKKIPALALAGGILTSSILGLGGQSAFAATFVKSSSIHTVRLPVLKAKVTAAPSYQANLMYDGIKVNADTALEQRLALAMINGQQSVDLSAFKEITNFSYLMDRAEKVQYQNPLIMGVIGFNYSYSTTTKRLTIYYMDNVNKLKQKQTAIVSTAKKIYASIIKPRMTDEQKFMSIYNYMEKNTKYDYNGAYATNGVYMSQIPVQYEDDFNAYGIIVKKLGVCQSYAEAFKLLSDLAGQQSVVVTGEHGGLHAWNKVLLNGKWLSVDPTASNTSVPYSIFEATDAKMTQEQYTPDKDWWTDSDMSKFDSTGVPSDYYTLHGLEAKSETQVITQVKKSIHNKQSEIFFGQCGKSCVNKFEINPPWQELG